MIKLKRFFTKKQLVLSDYVNKQPITVINEPYPHIHIANFFIPKFYKDLCSIYNGVLNRGLSTTVAKAKFHRPISNDAYHWLLEPNYGYPLDLFYSREWQTYFANIFKIELSNEVLAAFHYHYKGSPSSYIHHDNNHYQFVDEPLANGINPWYFQIPYPIYKDQSAQQNALIRIRKIAIIIYLNNEWQEGDGGETGIYLSRDAKFPIKKIPPLNNSLFAFEVSDKSFHAYLSNINNPRCSLNMWFHCKEASYSSSQNK